MSRIMLVCGAGGFIGGHLVPYLQDKGFSVRAVDRKPLFEWWQWHPGVESLCLDLSEPEACRAACENVE